MFGDQSDRMNGTSMYRTLSWNLDALYASAHNLKFLSGLQNPAQVRI